MKMVPTDYFGFFLGILSGAFSLLSVASSEPTMACNSIRPIHSSPTHLIGSISSPSLPRSYPDTTMQCTFKLIPQPDEQVQLTFFQFQLRESKEFPAATTCDLSDSIKIFIGSNNPTNHHRINSDPGNQLGEYCGRTYPEPVMSVGKPLTVVFTVRVKDKHDVNAVFSFRARYTFTKDYGFAHILNKTQADMNKTGGCLVTFDGRQVVEKGEFDSPNFGGLYPFGTNCMYTFKASGNQTLRLTFEKFDVDGHPDCRRSVDDFLYIKEGELTSANWQSFLAPAEEDSVKREPNATLYCGVRRPLTPAYTTTHYNAVVNVIFKSGQQHTKHGFRGHYTFTGHPSSRIFKQGSKANASKCSKSLTLLGLIVAMLTVMQKLSL